MFKKVQIVMRWKHFPVSFNMLISDLNFIRSGTDGSLIK